MKSYWYSPAGHSPAADRRAPGGPSPGARIMGQKRAQIGKASGYTHRSFRPDPVRYMSVTIATHRPAVTHADTRRDKKETACGPRFRSPEAVFAGGGRCWVRTNVG